MTDITFSDRLRAANQQLWDDMQAHRFVRDIIAGELPPGVFGHYLIYERAFVETAILIFGHALLKAPDLKARRWLCGVLNGLAGEQLHYFDRVVGTLGISVPTASPPASVTGFDRGMLMIAEEGSYRDIVVAMLAAEWMYRTWCAKAASQPITDPAVADWVRLHTEPGFCAGVDWLTAEVDILDAADFDRLAALFGRVLQLEIAFHTAPYDSVADVR